MDTSNTAARTALIGLVCVLAVSGTKVVNSTPDGAENSVPAANTIRENDEAEGTSVDPFITHCERESWGRRYDCACLGEHAPPVRAAWSKRMHEDHQSRLSSAPTPAMIAAWEEELGDDTKSEREKFILRKNIQQGKLTIEHFEKNPPPGPMAMPMPNLSRELAKQGVCRTGNMVEADNYKQCMGFVRHGGLEVDGDPETYCQCVGRTVAEEWTSGEMSLHSQAMSVARRQALGSCRP